MSCNTYAILGAPCCPLTIACTSNQKFIPLCSKVYRKNYSYMLQYPGDRAHGRIFVHPSDPGHYHPEVIKAYYGKVYDHDSRRLQPHSGHNVVDVFTTHDHGHDHAPGHGHGPDFTQGESTTSCKNC